MICLAWQRTYRLCLALHHPLSGDSGYASEFDKLRLWKLLQGRTVAVLLDGHWHTVHCQEWQGVSRVNGGATFGTHSGYNLVTVVDQVLRIAFYYWPGNESEVRTRVVPLLECDLGELRPTSRARLRVTPVVSGEVGLRCRVAGDHVPTDAQGWLNDDQDGARPLQIREGVAAVDLSTETLVPGWHFATVELTDEHDRRVRIAEPFRVDRPPTATCHWRETQLQAGVKAMPQFLDDLLIVASTDGRVTALSNDLDLRWAYDTGSQIVHSLVVRDDAILVGDIDGFVHCLRPRGWIGLAFLGRARGLRAGGGAAGWNGVDHRCLGMGARLHVADGRTLWSRRVAMHGFEASPAMLSDLVLLAAWDGFVYALEPSDGALAWKARCPTGQVDSPSRYYAAADCPPIRVADALHVCDRGWRVGRYSFQGRFQEIVAENIAAIAASTDGDSSYLKGLENQLWKQTAEGDITWQVAVPTGLLPRGPLNAAISSSCCPTVACCPCCDRTVGSFGYGTASARVSTASRGSAGTANGDWPRPTWTAASRA